MLTKLKGAFKPPPNKEVFTDDLKQVNLKYKILRNQILVISMVTYIAYYFTRQSVQLAGNALVEAHYTDKYLFSSLLLVYSIVYGFSKFIVGNFADRSSGRKIMVFGLAVSAILNLCLGGVIQTAVGHITIAPLVMMIIFIAMLGIFQGMGWPAVARMFANWYDDKERSVKLGIWSGAQGIGTILTGVMIAPIIVLINPYVWGLYFWIPSVFAIILIPVAMWGLRDRPESEGLPSIEKWKGIEKNEKEKNDLGWKELFIKYVFKNKFVWILAIANIFVYVVRQGVSVWIPQITQDFYGYTFSQSILSQSLFEFGGVLGGIVASFTAKWWFNNRKAPIMIIGIIFSMIGLIVFQSVPRNAHSQGILMPILILCGFGIYMPQTLIGATAIELTNKKAAATSSGFTGLLGYFGSSVMASVVVAAIVGNGAKLWDHAFIYFYACGAIAIVCLSLLWTKNQKDKIL